MNLRPSVVGFLGFLLIGSPAWADSPRALMAALGDSITAGTFADTSLTPESVQDPRSVERFLSALNRDRGGMSAEIHIDNRYTLSWATGLEINSQARRLSTSWLKSGDHRQIFAENAAIVNSFSDTLSKQIDQVIQRMSDDQIPELAYVTILSGSNDACATNGGIAATIDSYERNLMGALQKLATLGTAEHPVRVLISTLPRIADLGDPSIRERGTWLNLSCETVRTVLNECRPLTTWTTEEGHQAATAIVDRYNQSIEKIAAQARTQFPSLEVAVTHRFSDQKIVPEELAGDCFHPSQFAQEKIAAELWLDQPWF